jgi:hypothetical protein
MVVFYFDLLYNNGTCFTYRIEHKRVNETHYGDINRGSGDEV